jgi:hypothetical protein
MNPINIRHSLFVMGVMLAMNTSGSWDLPVVFGLCSRKSLPGYNMDPEQPAVEENPEELPSTTPSTPPPVTVAEEVPVVVYVLHLL